MNRTVYNNHDVFCCPANKYTPAEHIVPMLGVYGDSQSFPSLQEAQAAIDACDCDRCETDRNKAAGGT